jgi:hypothetical protein
MDGLTQQVQKIDEEENRQWATTYNGLIGIKETKQ